MAPLAAAIGRARASVNAIRIVDYSQIPLGPDSPSSLGREIGHYEKPERGEDTENLSEQSHTLVPIDPYCETLIIRHSAEHRHYGEAEDKQPDNPVNRIHRVELPERASDSE